MYDTTAIKIKCADGFDLTATFYQVTKAKAALMIAPATGIKRIFYHSFATFLAQNGYAVITFDNRGIGDSIGASINSRNSSLVDWGRLDMTAVLEHLKRTCPNTDYHLIGHSAGGQLVGLMENAKELKSMFNFACSSGSMANLKYPFKFKSHFFLNGLIPVSNLIFGHAKINWFGMGEPLPKRVASQWRNWCNGKGYVKVYLDKMNPPHLFDELDFPTLWLHATDDEIANLENVKDMIRVYSNIPYKIVTLHPPDLNYSEIGHMKFFSSKKQKLWQYAIDWLSEQK